MIGKLKAGKNSPQREREAIMQHIEQERKPNFGIFGLSSAI
jgi:hypothetical protein